MYDLDEKWASLNSNLAAVIHTFVNAKKEGRMLAADAALVSATVSVRSWYFDEWWLND